MGNIKIFISLSLILLFLPLLTLYPQVQINLYKYYNFANEEGRAIVKIGTNENYSNWSISGTSNTVSSGKQWYIAKLRADGTVIIFKTMGMPFDDSCFYMTRLPRVSKEHILAGHFRDFMFVPHASILTMDTNHNIQNAFILTNDSLGSTYKHITYSSQTNFENTGFQKIRMGPMTPFKIIASEFNIMTGAAWAKRYHINNYSDILNERGYSITYQPLDNSYAITGVTDRFKPGSGLTDIFVLKLNALGNPLWYKIYTFPLPFHSEANRIISLPDSAYAIAGVTNSPDTTRKGDIWIMKIDLNGNIKWSRIYGTINAKEAAQAIEYNSFNNTISFGGYFLTGGNEDILGGVINNLNGSLTGIPAFRANAGGNDRIYDMRYDFAGAIAIQIASTGSFGNPAGIISDFSYIRTDINFRYPGCLLLYTLDTIMLTPAIMDFPVFTEEIIHLPVTIQDSVKSLTFINECLATGMKSYQNNIPWKYNLEQNYPNPFNPITRIKYDIPIDGLVQIIIYDINGKEVSKPVNGYLPAGKYSIDFDAKDISSGIYFCKMISGSYVGCIRLIKIK